MHAAGSESRSRTAKPESGPVGDREIIVARDFDAPRELVYAAFVDPKHVPKWWGPRGYTLETSSIDVRVGGTWKFVLRSAEGRDFTNRIVYRELSAPTRIAYDHGSDVDDDPARFAVTITFDALDAGRTRVTMRSLFPTAAQRDGVVGFGAVELGQSTLEKGAAHVDRTLFVDVHPTEPRATIRRLLHAPRALVWEAMTRPEHVAHWYGPRATRMTQCSIDLRVGGKYRFVMRGRDGSEQAFSGVYREITPPERIVQTWSWEGAPNASSVESMRLIDLGGRTLVETSVEHSSRQNLEMHVLHGMEAGANETYARLDETLARIRALPDGILLERTFAAPRALVFQAWTDATHFSKWFGPDGVSVQECEIDARVGGVIRFVHRLPDGRAIRVAGTFGEVDRDRKITFTTAFVDEGGKPASPFPLPKFPRDARLTTTVMLEDAPGGTKQIVRQVVEPAALRDDPEVRSERAMASEGWKQTLDQLDRFVRASH